MYKRTLIKLAAALLLVPSLQVAAGVAVVVNPSVSVSATSDDISKLFLGKSNNLNGVSLTPIDQEEGSAVKEAFYQSAAKKTPSQLNAYWSRIIFTGKGQPPNAVFDDDEVKEVVAKDPSAIGYIDSGSVDASVKVISTFD